MRLYNSHCGNRVRQKFTILCWDNHQDETSHINIVVEMYQIRWRCMWLVSYIFRHVVGLLMDGGKAGMEGEKKVTPATNCWNKNLYLAKWGIFVLIEWLLLLQTQMAKFCLEIRPPCHAKEPSPANASSCPYTAVTS